MTLQLLQFSHLDLHGAWGESCDLLLHAVSNTRVHGGTTRQHIVGIQVLANINVTFHDAVVGGLMDTGRLHTWVMTRTKKISQDKFPISQNNVNKIQMNASTHR